MRYFLCRIFPSVFCLCIILNFKCAFCQDNSASSTLTGDWNGTRTGLDKKGITLEAVYTGEFISNLAGGLERKSTYLDNVDLVLSLNLDKLFSWKGGDFFIYGLGNHGGKPSEFVGDAQTISNIEAFSTWKIYEAWLQQNLFNNRLSVLVGLYDLNSEFQTLHSSSLFINSSHGIGPAFSQSGVNGPSIFPNAALGIRVKWNVGKGYYIQSVLLDGIPGDPSNPSGTRITFLPGAGVLSTTEIQYLFADPAGGSDNTDRDNMNRLGRLEEPEYKGKIGIGYWFYTARFPVIPAGSARGISSTANRGFYFIGEYKIFSEGNDSEQGLTLFARIGAANSDINRFSSYTGGGIYYRGLIPGRDEDEFGLAVAGAHNGGPYKKFVQSMGERVNNAEWNIEMTYSLSPEPWLTLQPDVQYVINPGTNPSIKNALDFGINFSVNF